MTRKHFAFCAKSYTGVTVTMQCRGIDYTVSFTASSAEENSNGDNNHGSGSSDGDGSDVSPGGNGSEGGSDTAQSGNTSGSSDITQGENSSGGNTTNGNGGTSQSGTGSGENPDSSKEDGSASDLPVKESDFQVKVYDAKKDSQSQQDAVVPGRSSLSAESLLRLTASTSGVPTIQESKTSGSSGQGTEAEETNERKESDLSVEDTEYVTAFHENGDQKWQIYSVDSMFDQQAENAGKVFQYAMLGVAGVGLLRLLFLFGKMKRGT